MCVYLVVFSLFGDFFMYLVAAFFLNAVHVWSYLRVFAEVAVHRILRATMILPRQSQSELCRWGQHWEKSTLFSRSVDLHVSEPLIEMNEGSRQSEVL